MSAAAELATGNVAYACKLIQFLRRMPPANHSILPFQYQLTLGFYPLLIDSNDYFALFE